MRPRQRAAGRLGFVYEGTFWQATIYKGRNRDTAWYSIIDKDWPKIRAVYEAWLAPDNFDASGKPRQRLSADDGSGAVVSGFLFSRVMPGRRPGHPRRQVPLWMPGDQDGFVAFFSNFPVTFYG